MRATWMSSVRHAEAARAEVESAIPELDNAMAAAKANLDLAQATFQRMQELAAKKSISNQEFDEASARLKAAQANYDMARSRRAQLECQDGAGGAGGARRRNHARLRQAGRAVRRRGDRAKPWSRAIWPRPARRC